MRNWLLAPGLAVLVWLVGFLSFVEEMPTEVGDLATHTDAIVVLTGGSERINTALSLLTRGFAERLFVSGVHKGVDTDDILRAAHMEVPKPLVAHIDLGHSADDTVGNAEETAAWVRDNNIQSVSLVTAHYHMLRSLWEFRRVMPDTVIVPHPVFPESTRVGQWNYAQLLIGEYSKYVVARARNSFKKGEGS